MTTVPRELVTKRPAQVAAGRPSPRRRKRYGRWVTAFVAFGLPLLFLTAAGLGFAFGR